MARLSKEKFALRGSIVILGAWVLFFLAGPIACLLYTSDAADE